MSVFRPIFDVGDVEGDILEDEPIFDVAQLAHVELLTPDLEGTLHFFKDLLGLEETERSARSAYLSGYEEQYHHSLKVTAAPSAGLGHVAWRARTPKALQRRVAAIEATGLGRGWINGDVGHGRAYQFETPEGHRMELFWDVDYIAAPAGKETRLRNRPQKRPRSGMPVRRIDHVNLLAVIPGTVRDFMVDILGFRERERVVDHDNGSVIASFMSVTNLSHDTAIVPDPTDMRGRFHHVCFYYSSVQHLFDVAEMAREDGVSIEHGPARHGIGGATVLYMAPKCPMSPLSGPVPLCQNRSGITGRLPPERRQTQTAKLSAKLPLSDPRHTHPRLLADVPSAPHSIRAHREDRRKCGRQRVVGDCEIDEIIRRVQI